MNDAQERALAALTNLLLTAPETPDPARQRRAFHVSRHRHHGPGPRLSERHSVPDSEHDRPCGEILGRRATRRPVFPSLAGRGIAGPAGHQVSELTPNARNCTAKLLEFYASSGESEAVIRGGREFSGESSPGSATHVRRSADGRRLRAHGKHEGGIRIYDSVLQELALKAEKMPLGKSGNVGAMQLAIGAPLSRIRQTSVKPATFTSRTNPGISGAQQRQPPTSSRARSPEYSRVLERYLARLVQLKQIPEALAVLAPRNRSQS